MVFLRILELEEMGKIGFTAPLSGTQGEEKEESLFRNEPGDGDDDASFP